MKERYDSNELLYLSRQGCPIARKYLIEQYYDYIDVVIKTKRPLLVNSLSYQDVRQTLILACIKAFDKYREDKGSSLDTYLAIVINSCMLLLLRKIKIEKENIYPVYQYYNGKNFDENDSSLYIAEHKVEYLPYKKLALENRYFDILKMCNESEQKIIQYKVAGYRANEIALKMNLNVKTVYNTFYRIRRRIGFSFDYK